jgi:hypothetical protein
MVLIREERTKGIEQEKDRPGPGNRKKEQDERRNRQPLR